jgi:Xaa-Pro dipeptidase
MTLQMFPESEYRARIAAAQRAMDEKGIDALLFSTEANIRYFSGYFSHRWLQSTSREFGVVTRNGDLILLLPPIEMDRARTHPWLRSISEATGEPGRGFVDQLASFIETNLPHGGKVGAELGAMLRVNLSHIEYADLTARLPNHSLVDGSDVFWKLRSIKSPAEVGAMRRALEIADVAYGSLRRSTKPGMTEKELHALIAAEMMRAGADKIGSMPLGSRSPNDRKPEDGHLRLQTDRRVQEGDMIWLDVGAVVDGYWSDTFRQYTLGKPSAAWASAYEVVYECFEAAMEALRPGEPLRHAMAAYERVLSKRGYDDFVAARLAKGSLGHSIGVDLVEAPIVDRSGAIICEPGMVFTIEPFLFSAETGFFMVEEQVLVGRTKSEVLSRMSPSQLAQAGIM